MSVLNPNFDIPSGQPIEDLLGYAIYMAAQAHLGQTDKADTTYILHPLEVMRMVAPDREAMIVAVLHDSVEDFDGTPMEKARFMDGLQRRFGVRITKAVEALTHAKGESYDNYIERVAGDYLARVVKIADLRHNMDPRRIPAYQIVDKDFERWDKYRRALVRLERH